MPDRKSFADTLGKLPGVSYACVLDAGDGSIVEAVGAGGPPVPVGEILDAFVGVAGLAGGRAGALQSVVVTGPRTVQVLAPAPCGQVGGGRADTTGDGIADTPDARGVLYVRLTRARANVAGTLREIQVLAGARPRPGVVSTSAALPTALPAALPAAPVRLAGPGAPPPVVPVSDTAAPVATRPAAPTTTTAGFDAPGAAPAPSGADVPGAVPTPRGVAGSVATEGRRRAPSRGDPTPSSDNRLLREPAARAASVAEFFAAAHRARPPLPAPEPDPARSDTARSAPARSDPAQPVHPVPAPRTSPTGHGPVRRAPDGAGPGPQVPGAAVSGASGPGAAAPRAAVSEAAADRAARATDPPGEASAAARPSSDGARDPSGGAARSGPPDTAPAGGPAPRPPAPLPRRTGRAVVPPPRTPPDGAVDERRWSTDLSTLRRLADGLRRRLS